MSSIWIILLDTSTSMDDGFAHQAGRGTDVFTETGAWRKKIDAAKDILLRQVGSLRAQDVAVIQFTDAAKKIFQGSRDALLRQTSLITSLTADGETSIAAAIDAVTADEEFEPYRSLSVLILTDGQSDKDEAVRAANELITKFPFARIDSIIIDETEKGREVVDAISLNGTVKNATSTLQLQTALTDARSSGLRGELQNMALIRFAAQQELSQLHETPPPTLIRVTSGETLNAATLRDSVAPTLLALESLDSAISIAQRREARGSVSSISQDSPISINLTGLKDAVQLVLEVVIPWRRRHAQRSAELDLTKRELDIEKAQLEITRSRLELAEMLLNRIDPDRQLSGQAREEALSHILSGIKHSCATKLEFVVVHQQELRG